MVDDKGSKGIPPPLDPFPTYQTPFPRSSSSESEENPFIAFRRFADSQISSLLSSVTGLPTLFAQSPTSGRWADLENEMTRRRQELEEGWRKQWEQVREEGKQEWENAKRSFPYTTGTDQPNVPARPQALSDIDKFVSDILKVVGDIELPFRQESSKAHNEKKRTSNSSPHRQMEVEKCPALREAGTELDMYESAFKRAMEKEKKQERKCHRDGFDKRADGWLSGVGWDGKQKQKNSEQVNETGSDNVQGGKTSTHTFRTTRRFDPVSNPDHTLPWLLTSPYSPVYISNPSQPRLAKVDMVDEPMVPFQILSPMFADRYQHPVAEQLARKLSWADAFEDLVSLEQTGKMVERNHSTWRTPGTWIHDMASRGSLGPRWGFDEQHRLMKKEPGASNDTWPSADAVQAAMKRVQDTQIDETMSAKQADSAEVPNTGQTVVRGVSDEALEDYQMQLMLLEQQNKERLMIARQNRDNITPSSVSSAASQTQEGSLPRGWEEKEAANGRPYFVDHTSRTTTWDRPSSTQETEAPMEKELISPEPEEMSETPHTSTSWSSTSASSWPLTTDDSSDTVISTLTTTETRSLPDGSIETKKVLKKQFADGREESNETLETRNAPKPDIKPKQIPPNAQRDSKILEQIAHLQHDKQTQTPVENQQPSRKSGWFWN